MRINNKTILGGVLSGTLIILMLIGFSPVLVQGSSINVVSINYTPSFSMATLDGTKDDSLSSSSSGHGSFQFIDGNFQAEHQVISYEDYLEMIANGNCVGSGTIAIESLYIYIYFYLMIVNPLGEVVQYTFTLEDIAGDLSINIVLGPDEIQIVEGTYHLSLVSELTIEYDGTTIFSGSLIANCSVEVIF